MMKVILGLLDTTDMIRAGEILSGITESDATKGESGDDWDWNWKSSVLIGTSNFIYRINQFQTILKNTQS